MEGFVGHSYSFSKQCFSSNDFSLFHTLFHQFSLVRCTAIYVITLNLTLQEPKIISHCYQYTSIPACFSVHILLSDRFKVMDGYVSCKSNYHLNGNLHLGTFWKSFQICLTLIFFWCIFLDPRYKAIISSTCSNINSHVRYESTRIIIPEEKINV